MAPNTVTPYDDILARFSPGPQSMRGFDNDYSDIVAYIIRCTYKIWEEKQVGLINSHYSEDAIIHTASGDILGSQAVLSNTIQQFSLLPDRRLFPEDVIWAGNDQDGFYSSHRIMSTAHHLGYSSYGAPTGKRLRYRVIADCVVKENKIVEEWLVRDDLSIIRQIGLDEHAYTARLVTSTPQKFAVRAPAPARGTPSSPGQPRRDQAGSYIEDFIQQTWHEVWNRRMFNRCFDAYLSTIHCHSASGRELFGHGDIIQFAIDWLACFPDGQMDCDHFCAVGDEERGYRTALRWTFSGNHTGYGIYGAPSGKPVRIMGITQALVQAGKIIEEWTVFDELNILCQLFLPEAANLSSGESLPKTAE